MSPARCPGGVEAQLQQTGWPGDPDSAGCVAARELGVAVGGRMVWQDVTVSVGAGEFAAVGHLTETDTGHTGLANIATGTSVDLVTVTQPGVILRGRGFEAQMDQDRVNLKSEVRAQYDPNVSR